MIMIASVYANVCDGRCFMTSYIDIFQVSMVVTIMYSDVV